MIDVPIDSIDAAFINRLIESEEREGKTLDYKRDLPKKGSDGKKSFLADVVSFANASGGYLLFGVDEARDAEGRKTGKPSEVVGISGETADEAERRLGQMVETDVDPRLTPSMQMKAVEGFEGEKVVLAVRVPRSWSAPHMVRSGDSRFYTRDSNRKHPMDAHEIRLAFAQSEELPRRIEQFRNERLGRIMAGETPVPVVDGRKVILHLIPVSAMGSPRLLDMEGLFQKVHGISLFNADGHDSRFNLDGVLSHTAFLEAPHCLYYTQFFRSGCVEAVASHLLEIADVPNVFHATTGNDGQPPCISGIKIIPLEDVTIRMVNRLQLYLAAANIDPPVVLFLTLTGVKGLTLFGKGDPDTGLRLHPDHYLIDRDDLLLPQVLIEDLNEPPDHVLKPAIDGLWQAAGRSGCPHYDKQGDWFSLGPG